MIWCTRVFWRWESGRVSDVRDQSSVTDEEHLSRAPRWRLWSLDARPARSEKNDQEALDVTPKCGEAWRQVSWMQLMPLVA